jgi:hypothetical protein
MDLGGCQYLIFVGNQKVVTDMDDHNGGLGMDRTMTSTLRPESVTTHVLRNDVLQQHIDVSRKSGDALCLFLEWCRPGPEN